MMLNYLTFDASESPEGGASFDAMAAVDAAALPALLAEVAAVLAWAHDRCGEPGPLDDGADWDYELQGVREVATGLDLRYDASAGSVVALAAGATAAPRTTVSLTLTGGAAFSDAFRDAIGVSD